MGILFIIIVVGWAVLAFVPTWIEHTLKDSSRPRSENISSSLPFVRSIYTRQRPRNPIPYAAIFDPHAKRKTVRRPSVSIEHLTFLDPDAKNKGILSAQSELTILDRDYVLKTGCSFTGNISVNGSVRIETDAILTGNITCSGSVIVARDGQVHGDIDSDQDIRIEANAVVVGSITSSRNVWVYENARIGSPGNRIDVRAREVVVAPTARVNGSIWADRSGGAADNRAA